MESSKHVVVVTCLIDEHLELDRRVGYDNGGDRVGDVLTEEDITIGYVTIGEVHSERGGALCYYICPQSGGNRGILPIGAI